MKRILCFLLTAAVFALCSSSYYTVSAEEQKAETVRLSASKEQPTNGLLWKIFDKSETTYFETDTENRLTFTAASPVRQLYFIFEKPCEWSLVLPGGEVLPEGGDGMIHKYIGLTEAAEQFEMLIPAGCMLTEVYAFTEGTLPKWVQVWDPPCDRADLLVLPAHADDELLWFGGAIPYYAGEMGYKVQVVYMTYHWKEPWRYHELLNGLWTVGVRNYPVYVDKFRDSVSSRKSLEAAEAVYGRDKVLEYQVEILRRFAPRVIIGHDINGEYGHGAHMLDASTLLEALEIYDNPAVYPESAEKYGITPVQKCYLHLWQENRITVSWSGKKLSRFGGKSALEMAAKGYALYKSQLRWYYQVEEGGKHDCRKFGLAYTTVGNDTPGENEMFEHVDWSERILPAPADDDGSGSSVSPSDQRTESGGEDASARPADRSSGWDVIIVCAAVAAVIVLAAVVIAFCVKKRGFMQNRASRTE